MQNLHRAAAAPQLSVSAWRELPPEIRARLEREGINSPAAWRALAKRRLQVFGITRRMSRLLDELARTAP